ncbi:hypothetical protein QSH18_06430 [Xanthomonas sp. NCPPB 2654]|uniref:hypothetical protein n=1 Tax=unclassified Xanthomonas TaxID=2643310 RepID=UPI0021DF4461|nr:MULTISPECIES: hypothetical protein [unclassified Xanthomonas]MDL5365236.1 hypothetical protein [Xanthomonas sp. NCPPB 2654]UYC19702.1 hypothetical protein NUG20_16210 [Xanthomonas sp. CFBP 8443]
MAIVVLAVYWPGLTGPFLFDDYPNIVDNAKIHLAELNFQNLKSSAMGYEPGSVGRPLATLSFALNWYFSGENAWSYKLTGVVVHVVNAWLVFALLLKMTRGAATTSVRRGIGYCLVVALLWAVHPLQVSTVLYVVQRMESLSLTFVLLALIVYLHGRQRQIEGGSGWGWLCFSGALALVGLLSKESAALFGAYAFSLEVCLFRFAANKRRDRRLLIALYLAFGLVASAIFFGWILPRALRPGAFQGRDFTLYERLLTQGRVLVLYLQQIALPLPKSLIFYYDSYPKSVGLLSPVTTLFSWLFIVALLCVGWFARRAMPLLSLGVFWFFAGHLLTSNAIDLELVFEHRNYFSLLGVLLVLAELVRIIPLRDGPAIKYVGVAAVVVFMVGLCAIRSATWGNGFLFFNELVDVNPQSARARTGLAIALVERANGDGDSPLYSLAEQQFEAAAALPSASTLPEQGLILMALAYGKPVKNEWWSGLISKLKTKPLSADVVSSISDLIQRRKRGVAIDDGKLKEACVALANRDGVPAFMYAQFGDYGLTYLHDATFANLMFTRAVEAGRSDTAFAAKMISTLLQEGHQEQASVAHERAKELGMLK